MTSKNVSWHILSVLAIASLVIAGCGEKTVTTSLPDKTEQNSSCLGCHESKTSPITGKLITQEWSASSHNLKNGAGCNDCHEADQNHPESCNNCHGIGTSTGSITLHNPDKAGKCAKCHTANAGFGISTFNNYIPNAVITRNTLKSHFNNTSSSYVSSQNVNNCRKCHNPHDTSTALENLKAWARSGHGRTKATPWTKYDFKTALFGDPNAECNRCHTTTGFIKYVTTGDSKPWGDAADKTKEMLGCNACHNDYSYSVRSLGAVTAHYKGGDTTYPTAGESNICLNCHVGRENGDSIKSSTADFTNVSFINSHYLTAGGSVFGKTAYTFGTRNYDSHVKNNGSNNDFVHDLLGREDVAAYGKAIWASEATQTEFNNAAEFIKAQKLENAGPCVVCHLTSKIIGKNGSHTFQPYTIYSETDRSLNAVCVNCHTARGEGSNSKIVWFDGEWKRNITAGLDVLKELLNNKGLYYYNSNPYFFKDADGNGTLDAAEAIAANAIKDWTLAFDSNRSKETMGAAFNYNLLSHDPGAIAHNRMYVRRILYDSIDFMDDGVLNYSVGTTIKNLSASSTRDYSAVLLIANIKHNGFSGAARLPDYTKWNPTTGDANERY